MTELASQRRAPFAFAAAALGVITLAIFRLPESLVTQIQNSGFLSLSARGWTFRLLAFFAVVQALYMGYSVLRTERVKRAREREPRIARMTRERVMRSLIRSAVGAVFLTMIYGIAAFSATGFRAGFWLFAGIALAQGAWYYRQTGEIAEWFAFQPETADEGRASGAWIPAPPDYCPPIARGLSPTEVRTATAK